MSQVIARNCRIWDHASLDAKFFARLRARCSLRFQKAETKRAKAAHGAFFAKGAKNVSFEERAKV
ncbi:MAG: hypothetical protein H7834_12680 [Magnetococcus sp. YQC-9]